MNESDTNMIPLDELLAAHDWSPETNGTQASPAMVGALHRQRDVRLDRVDVICRQAEDTDRDLLASEGREVDKLHGEVDAIDRVIVRAAPVAENLERIRREHNRLAHRTPPDRRESSDPRALTISRSLRTEVTAAVRARQSISRALTRTDLTAFDTPSPSTTRGRLAMFATVRESFTPQAAFVPVNPVAPAAVVAEGAAKPQIADATTIAVVHQKIAGYVDLTIEEIVYGVDVGQAVEDVAFRQLIAGENVAIVAVLVGAPNIAASTTPAKSILAGISAVAAGGGQADVIALNPGDIPAVLGESTSLGYVVNAGGGAETLAPTLWNVPVVAATGVTAGTAFVWDTAALGMSVALPPTLLVDPYSQSLNNKTRVVIEELVGFALIASAMAAEVDLSP